MAGPRQGAPSVPELNRSENKRWTPLVGERILEVVDTSAIARLMQMFGIRILLIALVIAVAGDTILGSAVALAGFGLVAGSRSAAISR